MRKALGTTLTVLCLSMSAAVASATTIDLFEYALNINGTVSDPTLGDPIPAGVDVSGFNDSTGLGTMTITVGGAGAHNVDVFVDHEIDEAGNTYFNESGAESGAPVAGRQSWEIDEPGFVFGNIYDNLLAGILDNTNAVPAGLEDDVSMALGWDFTLAAGETAAMWFVLSDSVPSGFYLSHTDSDSNATIYFSSRLDIQGGPAVVPEPGTLVLLGTGLAGLGALASKRQKARG
jgi:hypothetical protein